LREGPGKGGIEEEFEALGGEIIDRKSSQLGECLGKKKHTSARRKLGKAGFQLKIGLGCLIRKGIRK